MTDRVPFTPLYVNGQYRPGSTNQSYEVRNPYSGKLVGLAAAATSEDCGDAVEAAGKAFPSWEAVPLIEKSSIFLKAADLLLTDQYKERVKSSVQEEIALVDDVMTFDWSSSAGALRDIAGMIHELKGENSPSAMPGGHYIGQRRAMGVIFAIAPWNLPITLSIRAVGVPILCGNTVVLKCSEVSPRSQAIVADLFHEAGLPNGVLNFISTDRKDAPTFTAEIIAHPLVRKINFTGSDRVGRVIAIEAAKYLKPCVLELGGKSPAVVLDDADTEKAARAIVSSGLISSGQGCISTERAIVQRRAAETLVPAMISIMKSLKAGDPTTDPSAKLSAMFATASSENAVNMIKEAQAEGAKVLVGDVEHEGTVMQPHLVTDVQPGMRLWDRETFAPIIVLAVADTVDELVDLANKSDYSLSAAVWTRDYKTALNVSSRIYSGTVNVNGQTLYVEPMKDLVGLGGSSGYGRFGVADFTDMRSIIIHPDTPTQYPLVG